ncbi:MAG: flagellar hook-associated protein FlgK [Saliniramus fredricksonii]|uniref:Flagellar hook-associated protein 1 n=1 Tax=Saliniramus fredricksonii TaxID=1653334 RepID=A0A0N8KEE4_9HYPH|nr:flagellar hook-associated protein FlgK [Saliniramus fredricksonii]KPQ11106.1 MAG: flagellar hook-associated protein FlgK [Saliniramus fredricksonii]SCC78118.1 flagellar hook-associated protein 1 FlgK [Saliniramus fredricksonii]
MSLMSALSTAVSGLRTTQTGMNLVAQNVANVDSAGYTRKTIQPVQTLNGPRGAGVQAGPVQRVMDDLLSKQLRTETSGAGYAKTRAEFASALDGLFGTPGEASSLDHAVNTFNEKLGALADDPSSFALRAGVLSAGETLAGRMASVATGVQGLRSQAEGRIDTAVTRANELLKGIADTNSQITAESFRGGSAELEDERDRMINELSGLMGIEVQKGDNGAVIIRTPSGQTLFDGVDPTTLSFDRRPALDPSMSYDPVNSDVGVIRAETGSGARFDLIAGGAFQSGEIAAALEMRDEILPQAQRQLDEMAAGFARAFSDRPAEITGNTIAFGADFSDEAVTVELMNDGAFNRLSIPNPAGAADLEAEFAAAGFTGVTVNDLGGGDWEINGLPAGANLLGARYTVEDTQRAAGDGVPELPFFVDRGNAGNAFTGVNDQLEGFAQRMGVNGAIKADPAQLIRMEPGTPSGDQTRIQTIRDNLEGQRQSFAPQAGIGGMATPYSSNVMDFSRRVVETQGANAQTAQRLNEGQNVALAAIESRFGDVSGVNIDEEMSQLVQLQTAYGANARVLTAVREMMDTLMRM